MITSEVTVARIYLTEGEHRLDKLLHILQHEEAVAGLTVFRGIAGFGQSGKLHTATLVDMSLDLPVVVEFFDRPAKMGGVLERVAPFVGAGHVLTWQAGTNVEMD
jgi:PII-like signaling protein